LGITAADAFSALGFLKAGKLKVVLPTHMIPPADDHIQLYAVYPHRTHLAPRVRLFIEFAVQCARSVSLGEFDPTLYAA